jgi:ATP-dependent DNA helicase RecG
MDFLDRRVDRLVGARTGNALAKHLGIGTVRDLLNHYPFRLADRGSLTDLNALVIGEHATVSAEVADVKVFSMRPDPRRRGPNVRHEVIVTDGTGQLVLTFFRQPYIKDKLAPGTRGLFSGKVGLFNGRRQLAHPAFQVFPDEDASDVTGEYVKWRLIPVYPATQRIASWEIAKATQTVVEQLPDDLPDPLPAVIRERHGLIGWTDAMRGLHHPTSAEEWGRAKERLKFDEAFVLQTVLAQRRHVAAEHLAVARPRRAGGLLDHFDAQLPYALTTGQREVGDRLSLDLAAPHPMQRLLQGEVGSGKTVVALRAMLQVVDAGGQAALLAPTEVLAQQHFRSITDLLGPMAQAGMLGGSDLATRVALVTGSLGSRARRSALLDAQSGAAGIVIGTHALLEEQVQFAELGLVVVDEQHRFGVEQRAGLTTKAKAAPHVLVMTATPIPRTVAMTVFGDLDVSTMRDLPPGRAQVTTTVVPLWQHPRWLDRAWERIREEVAQGRQAYVVCTRIDDTQSHPPSKAKRVAALVERDSDRLPGRQTSAGNRITLVVDDGESLVDLNVEEDPRTLPPTVSLIETYAMLIAGPLAGLRVEMLHGRLAPDVKDDVMLRFAAGEIDVLVSTTVVEVGVDVANASVMVVMDADRFGVSQLHQLRGRVGRRKIPGLCLLVTAAFRDAPSLERLEKVAATSDGFELSRVDLEYRREGDVLGAAQAGTRSSLRLLSVFRDEDVIAAARADAELIVAGDPGLVDHPELALAVADLEETEAGDFLERS